MRVCIYLFSQFLADEISDQPISNGTLTFIWAKGSHKSNYISRIDESLKVHLSFRLSRFKKVNKWLAFISYPCSISC